jgi:hypothetical protein
MPSAQEWEDLFIYLANSHSRDLITARLERVSGPWPPDLEQLRRTMEMAAPHQVQELLLLHLLARVLAAGRSSPAWVRAWIDREGMVESFLPGLDFREALSLAWSAVPVPIVRVDGRGCVLRMMVAHRPGSSGVTIPEWARENLEMDFQEAVATGLEAARRTGQAPETGSGFYCWPLLDPGGPLLQGASLGLSLALAFSLLSKGTAWPADLMVTGGISRTGEVLPVGGLHAKVQAAAESEVKLFLYPDEEKIDFNTWSIPVLPVNDLQQAMTFAQLMALGLPALSNFRLYYSCLQDAELMLDNYHQLPPQVLVWARDRGLLSPLKRLAQEAGVFRRFVDRLSDRGLSHDHRQVLASLLRPEEVDQLARRSSQDALNASNWYHSLALLAQESRDQDMAGHWRRKAGRVLREFGDKIYVFYRTEEHQGCYESFDRGFRKSLGSRKAGPLKSVVGQAWRKKLVFLHLPVRQGDDVSARVFLNDRYQVVGISLNAAALGVDPETGEARDMEACVNAVYLGLIRAAFVANHDSLMADGRLHMLLADFLHRVVSEILKGELEPEARDDALLRAACRHYYLQHLLSLDPARPESWTALAGSRAAAERSRARLRRLEASPGPEDLSALLARLELTPHPDWLRHRLPDRLGREASLAVGGMLDLFLGICVLAHHPPPVFEAALQPPEEISRQVEKRLLPFLQRLQYFSQDA